MIHKVTRFFDSQESFLILLTYGDRLLPIKSYQSVYGHQTWHDFNVPCWVPSHKITRHFLQVVLEYHVINWNHFISPTIRDLARFRDKLKPLHLHCSSGSGHQNLQDGNFPWGAPSYKVKWFLIHVVKRIRWEIKNIFSLPQCSWLTNLTGWWHTIRIFDP